MEEQRPTEAPDNDTAPRKRKRPQTVQEAEQKNGVIYISRIPPHMKPQKLRHLLSQHGEIGRLYMAPEDPGMRKLRKKQGGNTGKNFTEGWVEFEDKQVAKQVAAALNTTPIGGKHRSAYHFDLWCMKYLPKFKWDYLTEEIAYQKAVRDQKLAAEISAAKRERDFYLSRVDRAKAQAAMEERRRKRQQVEPGEGADTQQADEGQHPKQQRAYNQKRPKADTVLDASAPVLSADVLSLIAGSRRGRQQDNVKLK